MSTLKQKQQKDTKVKSLGLKRQKSSNTTDKQDYSRLIEIEDSPFRLYHKDNDKYIIILGNIQTDKKEYENQQEAIDNARKITWENIMTVVFATIQLNQENNK